MTNISVPVPPSLQVYREPLREFLGLMMRKLDLNSHKKTPKVDDIPKIILKLKEEIVEFEDQYKLDPMNSNSALELADQSNFAFLAFVALRNKGFKTGKERLIEEFLLVVPSEGRVFCKKTRPGSQYKVGQEIKGSQRKGYVDIKLQSRRDCHSGTAIPRSHLVWYSEYGKWPTGVLDHINRKKGDDRICNLRDVTFSENNYNNVKVSSYPRHVTCYKPSGRSHLKHWGKYVYQRHYKSTNLRFAYYDTPEEASIKGSIQWEKAVKKLNKEKNK